MTCKDSNNKKNTYLCTTFCSFCLKKKVLLKYNKVSRYEKCGDKISVTPTLTFTPVLTVDTGCGAPFPTGQKIK